MTQQLLLKQPIATLWNLKIFKFDNIFALHHFETQSSETKSFAIAQYSLIYMRLLYYFNTWAIIWHGIVPVFLKICTDLQEICSIWVQNCFCYCFWTILLQEQYLTKTILLANAAIFIANLCKSSEILEHCHVKWWLKYQNNRSVSLVNLWGKRFKLQN